MPENASETVENTTVQTPKISSIGKVERVTMTFPQEGQQESNSNTIDNSSDQSANQSNEGANAIKDANEAAVVDKTAAPTFTDQQLKEYFKTQGIEYEGVDKLKDQLKPKDTPLAPTEEQIKAKELAKEKRLLDKFISGGGTAEQYVSLKTLASADQNVFAINQAKADLIKGGYTAEEADVFIKENLFQIEDAELEKEEDETEKQYKKRTKDFFAKQLAANSNPFIEKAKWALQNLNEVIESEDLHAQQEVAFSAKIDEDFKALPRKLSIEIGEIGGKTVSPVDYDVSETDIAEVKAILKNPETRQQLLFNQDGSLNITRITQALLKEKAFDSASKISYLEAQTRTNEHWQKVFPARSAQELGVGGSQQRPNGQNGSKIAGVGKVQRVQPQRQ